MKYGLEASALYGMGIKLIAYPLTMISGAVSQIVAVEIALSSYSKKIKLIKLIKLIKILIVLSIIIIIGLYLFSDYMIELYLGAKWIELKEYIIIIGMIAVIRFIVSPVSSALGNRQHLKIVLKWQILYLLTMSAAMFLSTDITLSQLLLILAVHEAILYSIYAKKIISVWR